MSDLLTTLEADDELTETRSRSDAPPIRATDAERLMRFWRQRDQTALAELIEQHAGMVWGEALRTKAKMMGDTGVGSQSEVLEAEAEAELALAEVKLCEVKLCEVKLCEVNALQIREQLKALEASQLKEGSGGVQVRMLQQQLNVLLKPCPGLDVDGDFGPLTAEAVKLFQKQNGLNETGVVDQDTAAKLGLPLGASDVLKQNLFFNDAFGAKPVRLPLSVPTAVLNEARLMEQTQAAKQAQAAAKAAAAAGARGGKAAAAEKDVLVERRVVEEQQLKALRSAVNELQEKIQRLEAEREEESR